MGAATNVAGEQTAPTDPVRHWLRGMVVQVPTISIPADNYVVTLSKFACQDIELASVASGHTCSATKPQLSLSVSGVTVNCAGLFDITQAKDKKDVFSGSADAKIPPSTAGFQLSLARDLVPPNLARSVSLDTCSLAPKVQFKLHGNDAPVINAILDLVTPIIDSYFEGSGLFKKSGLPVLLCSMLTELVKVNGTALLTDVNARMQPFLPPLPPFSPLPATLDPGKIDLQSAALSGLLKFAVDKLVAPQLNKLVKAFTHNSGSADLLSAPLTITLPVPGLANLSVTLHRLHVGGLDTWNTSYIENNGFEVLGPETLSAALALGELSMQIDFSIGVSPDNSTIVAGRLEEAASLHAKLHAFSVSSRIGLGLDAPKKESLSLVERRSPACILGLVDTANATASRVNFLVQELELALASEAGTGIPPLAGVDSSYRVDPSGAWLFAVHVGERV